MKPERIGDNLAENPGWTTDSQNEAIVRTFHLMDFDDAVRFVHDVAAVAISEGHFPTITLYLNQVQLRLTTPAADGLTDKDFEMAKRFTTLA
jgi:4a-hydroxytetrahydrobiopterin dehydratase